MFVLENILPLLKEGLLCCLLSFGTFLFLSQDIPAMGSCPRDWKFTSEASWNSKIDRQFFYLKFNLWYEEESRLQIKVLQPSWLDGSTSNFQIFSVCACLCVRQRGGETDRQGEWLEASWLKKTPTVLWSEQASNEKNSRNSIYLTKCQLFKTTDFLQCGNRLALAGSTVISKSDNAKIYIKRFLCLLLSVCMVVEQLTAAHKPIYNLQVNF